MKVHATKRILIGLLQGDLNVRNAASVKDHINSCSRCRANYDVLTRIASPSPGKNIKPGRAVYRRIIDFYDRYALTHRNVDQAVPSRKMQMRYAAAAAAACGVVIMFAVYTHFQYEYAPIHAAKVKGLVRANKSRILKGQRLQPGDLLTTGEDSKLAIMYGKIMKLIAGPHTRIAITKSHIDRNTGKIYFEMVINQGSIIAVFDKTGNLEYTLITPHGKVSSRGSRIAMKVDSSKTRVMVKDGSANLSSSDGNTVGSDGGSGYSITNKEVTSAMEPSDDDDDDNNTLYDKTVRDLLDDDDDDVVTE